MVDKESRGGKLSLYVCPGVGNRPPNKKKKKKRQMLGVMSGGGGGMVTGRFEPRIT